MNSEANDRLSTIEVAAPSRLHFGMLSFGNPAVRQFGGVGAMIDQPGLQLRISPADRLTVVGPMLDRVRRVVARYCEATNLAEPPRCRIEVTIAPPEHVGLGAGTQLALAVAAGLNAIQQRERLSPTTLTTLTGRAVRSAVGTYGFCQGGLIFESGKLSGETLSPLEQRVELSAAWRFVLVCPRGEQGLSGQAESEAFDDLPPVPSETTERLTREVTSNLLPAAVAREFTRFSESLYRYGCEAGLCFASRQGGAFASPAVASLVEAIRQLGVRGVGQSSWGPTVFALLENQADAERLVQQLTTCSEQRYTMIIAKPNNTGARIERRES